MTKKIAEALLSCLLLGCVQVSHRDLLDARPLVELSYEVPVSTFKKTRMYQSETDKDVRNSFDHVSSKLEITPVFISCRRDTVFLGLLLQQGPPSRGKDRVNANNFTDVM